MIPKVIHYVWLGQRGMNTLHQRCVDSWRRIVPDYELKLWNENNADIDNEYCRAAIKAGKWAFVSDWIRFDVLYKEGGIYLDTDVELVRPPDSLLESQHAVLGWEAVNSIGTATLMAPREDKVMGLCRKLMIEDLQSRKIFSTSPIVLLHAVNQMTKDDYTLLPKEVFFPFCPFDRLDPNNAGQLMLDDIKPATVGIHHYRLDASWSDSVFKRRFRRILRELNINIPWGTSFDPWPKEALSYSCRRSHP